MLAERQRGQVLQADCVALRIVTFVMPFGGCVPATLVQLFLTTVTITLLQMSWPLFLAGLYLIPWMSIAVLVGGCPTRPPSSMTPPTCLSRAVSWLAEF
ncbi:hypothetical protein [Pseudonocardia spinosispora]|uniref:hypothetical protein n=1 Tax=Pseudonocardia spinosispora TaxID=103441 RepID=UPI00041679B0|nr:hypothetical protein [Pseudonocardia spinosispora]